MYFLAKGGPRTCPVEGCLGILVMRTAMQVHFVHRHVLDTVVILEEGNFPNPRVAVRIIPGGNAPHTGEELKGTRGPNSSGGTKKLTRLTSKYVLQGKTEKAKIIRQLKSSLFSESRRCADSSYDQRAQS